MAGRSDAELDALVEQAIVDAYDEYEQLASLSRSALAGSIGRRSASWICRCRPRPGPAPCWRRMDRRLPALGHLTIANMSEYQYYELLAVDQPLGERQG